MSITFDPTLTGFNVTGFTSPIYDNEDDLPPNGFSRQRIFTGLTSGTVPAGLSYHSVSSPCTATIERPAAFKSLPPVNPVTGVLPNVPRNVWKIRIRKGVLPLAGQSPVPMVIETKLSVPAGADLADPDAIRQAYSIWGGEVSDLAIQFADAMINGDF